LSRFDETTTLEAQGDGRWRGRLAADWNIGDNPNGGYMVATVLGALAEALPHPDPLSVTTHYLRPGVADEACEVRVDVLRTGRSLSTARARLVQEDKVRLEVLAAYGDLTVPAGVDADLTLEPPELPAPDDCVPRTGDLQGVDLPIVEQLDIRLHPAQARGEYGAAEMSGWIRFRDDRVPDARALLLFADAFPPSPLALLGAIGWVPTLELTVHVRRRPAPGWIRARLATDDLVDGRMIESGALWDSTGALVAQCRQLGLVMRRDPA